MAHANRSSCRLKPLTKTLVLALSSGLLLLSCAKEREVAPVAEDANRVKKETFAGSFYFLKSLQDVRYPGIKAEALPPGLYLDHDKVVRFEIKEHTLEIVSETPQILPETEAKENAVLAVIPIKHVDVLRIQNEDGEDTHEEEQTEDRRPWNEREYVILDLTQDLLNPLEKDAKHSEVVEPFTLDAENSAFHFSIQRNLQDKTQITELYSFMRPKESSEYQPKPYPREDQTQVGFFKTTVRTLNPWARLVDATNQDFLQTWDISTPKTLVLSKNFPNELKDAARQAIEAWNETFEKSAGVRPIQLKENEGEHAGDLRYNMLVYDDSDSTQHGLLAYAPAFADPRTGEIIKADIFLYGNVLKQSIDEESRWKAHMSPNLELEHLGFSANNLQLELTTLINPFGKNSILKGFPRLKPYSQHRYSESLSRRSSLAKDVLPNLVSDPTLDPGTGSKSPLELSVTVTQGLLLHELGHWFGLSHNFKASADAAHYPKGGFSSSVMDYPFLQSQSPRIPGEYDAAALSYAYKPSPAKRSEIRAEFRAEIRAEFKAKRFLFCSDDQLHQSEDGLCHAFDRGTTLTEIASSFTARFDASKQIYNFRLGRLAFEHEIKAYEHSVLSQLLPIRRIHDHSESVLRRIEAKDYVGLYNLAGPRLLASKEESEVYDVLLPAEIIESKDPASKRPKIELQTLKVGLSKNKVDLLKEDARKAKARTFDYLQSLVLKNPLSDYDLKSSIDKRIERKGSAVDKQWALFLLLAPLPDPYDPKRKISPFISAPRKGGPWFLNSLLSQTKVTLDSYDPEQPTGLSLKKVEHQEIPQYLREWAIELTGRLLIPFDDTAFVSRMFHFSRPRFLAFGHRDSHKEQIPSIQRLADGIVRDLMKELPDQNSRTRSTRLTPSLMDSYAREVESIPYVVTEPETETDDTYWVAPSYVRNLDVPNTAGWILRYGVLALQAESKALQILPAEIRKTLKEEGLKPPGLRNPAFDESKLLAEEKNIGPRQIVWQREITHQLEREKRILERLLQMAETGRDDFRAKVQDFDYSESADED